MQTNGVGYVEAIATPSCSPQRKVYSIRQIINFNRCCKVVIVSIVKQGVSKDEVARNLRRGLSISPVLPV
jgi:hypothetical protein